MNDMTRKGLLLTGIAVAGCFGPTPNLRCQAVKGNTPADVVMRVLTDEKVSGGIESYVGCRSDQKNSYTAVGETVDNKLTSLKAAVPNLQWRKIDVATYRIEIGQDNAASLMDVVIPSVTLQFYNVHDATDQLLDRQEVEANIKKTHLKLFAAPVGFSDAMSKKNGELQHLELPTGTIADDLDQIAKTVGARIWLYSAYDCDGTLNGRLLWSQ
jgi:hypothetical protein